MSDPWSNPFEEEEDDYATSPDADEQWGEVHIDGIHIPIQDQFAVVNLATLPQRLTFGDHTLASDSVLSVWVQSDWTGGGQIEDMRESSHGERFLHGTAETRFPRMLSQPPETLSYTIAGSPEQATPVGDYDDAFYAAFDLDLCSWDGVSFTSEDTLAAFPVAKGVVYDDLLWIPQGASGYETWDGATLSSGTAGITPVSLVEWDDKLVALEHDGQISVWDGFSWTSETQLRLRGDATPRSLVVWWSADRFPTIYVVTSRDVWAVDFLVPILYRTGLRFPIHPDHGLASAVWRDDAMYVSVGMGVHQMGMGPVISAMGLDRDDGMPAEFRGRIVDMEPEYNGLYALVEGLVTDAVVSEEFPGIEETMLRDDSLIVPTTTSFARSTLQTWTGIGWHTAWQSDDSSGTPSLVQVSQADGEYRVWWGYAGSMYTQALRRTFHNPRQGALAAIDRFASESYVETGKFDANLTPLHKLASHIEVHLDQASSGEVDVYYGSDHFAGWEYLGTASGTGQQFIRINVDDNDHALGDSFHWIKFRYVLRNTDPTETVLVNWITLYFVPRPLQSAAFRGIALLDKGDEQHQGEGFREIADFLDGLTTAEHFSVLKHRDRSYRVLMAQTSGNDRTGKDLRSGRTFQLVEVNDHSPLGGDHDDE